MGPAAGALAPAGQRTGARAVERDAFDAFVATHSTGLVRTAYLLTHDRGLAEDLVQTSLAKAWFAWGRIEGQPHAYVRRVMVNTYSSWWRRRWNGEVATEPLPESAGRRGAHVGGGRSAAGDAAADVEARTDLWAALARLPRRQRAVVVLRYYEDLSEVATAEIMQCSVGTVKSQASKALAKLRLDTALQTSTDEKGIR
jgi:RNA polymerase sigma-70 factor (sigma-E family)